MRRLLSFLLGAAGVAAGARLLHRRGRRADAPAGDPAAELRRRLDESREIVGERGEFEAGETPVDAVEDVAPPSLEERRRRVHERAQEAIESMRLPDE
jgi:hypothetical protein